MARVGEPIYSIHRLALALCPRCVPEIRKRILDGDLPVEILRREKVGEIKAQIIERDGRILMVKDCAVHGRFEDVISIDPAFYRHLEETYPGRDINAHADEVSTRSYVGSAP
jgi:uncharacterized radical SAM superfamily Fe-S cluster-containing enzyme